MFGISRRAAGTAASIGLVSVVTHWTGSLAVGFVALALAYFLVFYRSVRRYPNTTCRTCSGSAKNRDPFFFWAHRPCTRCSASTTLTAGT